jgi:hypothetical protein
LSRQKSAPLIWAFDLPGCDTCGPAARRPRKPAAITFWDQAKDLPGVLEVATGLMTALDAPFCVPDVAEVAALTAARLGLAQQAREHANAASARLSPDEARLLDDLIDQQLTTRDHQQSAGS